MSQIISSSHRKSFTLLELLVAMAILSVIVVAIYTTFRGGTDSWTRGRAMSDVTQNARVVLESISREISSVIISPYTDLNNATDDQDLVFVGQNSGDSDSLDFTAMLRSPDSSDKYAFGLLEIGYGHDSADDKIERRIDTKAIWNSAGTADDDPLAGGSTNDLAYNVTELNFEYWDPASTTAWDNGTTSKLEWDTRLVGEGGLTAGTYDDDKLPSAVKITITVVDDPDPAKTTITKEFSTVVYLPGSEVF